MQAYLDHQQLHKKRRNFRIKIYFILLAAGLLFLGMFYVLAYSPVFHIRQFKISGAERLSDQEVIKILEPLALTSRMDNFFGAKNLLSWGQKPKVENTSLKEAAIDRDWLGQTVMIVVKERERLASWCNKNNICYWIDEDGTAFEEAPETEGSLILTVYGNRERPVIQGTKVAEERFIENIIKILKGILDLKVPIKKVVFDGRLQEVQITSYSGPDLLFSIRFDPNPNLSSLQSLKEKIDLQKIKYLDLRVENRIFYKN